MTDADRHGLPRDALRRLEHRGEVSRVGKSAFIRSDTLSAADSWTRLRYRAIGFARCLTDDAHLTGPAAAALWQIPFVQPAPALPTVLRPGNPHLGHSRTPWGRLRFGHLPPERRARLARVRVVDRIACAVDQARHRGSAEGLIAADLALRTAGNGLTWCA